MEKRPADRENLPNRNDAATNREHQHDNFPGYPHYPPRQDIEGANSDAEQTDVDLENFSRNTWTAARDETPARRGEEPSDDLARAEDFGIRMGTEADVTEEDLTLLGDPDRDLDGGDDELIDHYEGLDDTDFDGEPLNERTGTLAATGDDLDLPDDEADPDDEENDYFSLGGDKDSLEDDQAGDTF